MIDDLQITQEARNLVRALSHNFAIAPKSSQQQTNGEATARRPWSADFVPGKGGGRIILLHGKPGVGKTSTAECVAELTKRPLLTITCGDLGTNAMSVDQELTRWLRLGTLWNAVLLFDEADVFLEARAHGDIDRNSLVSVFLRALEYYQGLMFLTTNRIGSFDEAIISRIHVVLHLPNLTDTDRERIWNTSFRKLGNERHDISVDYPLLNYAYHDDEIRKLGWNGREIRNAFNTMIALAEWDAQQHGRYTKDGKVEVRREHLQEVARMSSAFKLYLKSLRAMEHEEYTKSLGLRDDRFRAKEGR
jgi:SpoVK/Ycf46/Vps4 family AAA+-type ATPase